MFEIGNDELLILSLLIHAEFADAVIAESKLPEKVGIDIIRQLFHHGYIMSINQQNIRQISFDVDGIKNTRFQMTAKGISALSEGPAK
jgi:hypothetical protein